MSGGGGGWGKSKKKIMQRTLTEKKSGKEGGKRKFLQSEFALLSLQTVPA